MFLAQNLRVFVVWCDRIYSDIFCQRLTLYQILRLLFYIYSKYVTMINMKYRYSGDLNSNTGVVRLLSKTIWRYSTLFTHDRPAVTDTLRKFVDEEEMIRRIIYIATTEGTYSIILLHTKRPVLILWNVSFGFHPFNPF